MPASRCYYLDFAKVAATFLVIFGHLYSPDSTVRLYLYAFHMPLFFLISGIFHRYNGIIDARRYCKTILWPTFIFIILAIFLSDIVWKSEESFLAILKTYVVDIPLGKYHQILWFLFALFWCKIFADFIIRIHRPFIVLTGWAFILFGSVLMNIRLPFMMTQGLMALPFYLTGFYAKDKFLHFKPSFKWVPVFLGCIALCVLITRLHGRVSMLGIHFGQLASIHELDTSSKVNYLLSFGGDVILFYLNGLIGSIMILALALLPFPESPVITPISKSLITVVGTQYLFITPIIHFIGYDQSAWVSIPLCFGVFVLCYLMHIILRPVYQIVQ